MGGLPDPDWYLDNILAYVEPGGPVAARGSAGRWDAWWQRTERDCAATIAGRLAATQGFVLTAGQLVELGWQHHDIRREIRRGAWNRPTRGVVSPVVVADRDAHIVARRQHALVSSAPALLRPDHVVSGRSAAILHGLPTFAVPDLACLTAHDDTTLGRRRTSALVRGATLTCTATMSWFGVPITTILRTLLDLARHDRRDGLMACDAALRERLINMAGVEDALATAAGWPGVRQARDVLALASPLAESALESLVRLALHDEGFPAPELQVEIGGYRVDLLWRAQRLILEADGRGKYTNDELWQEKVRETRLRALGYRIERVLWSDITRYWPQTSARLRAALAG